MTVEQRPKEWHETEERALSYLRDATAVPSAPPLTGYSFRFRLWHYPAFEASRSWSVFELRRARYASLFAVRQVTWDRPFDCQRLRDPLMGLKEGFHTEPKIEVRDRSVDASELATRLAVGHSIAFPIIGFDNSICVDGEMFGYEKRDGSLRLEWCCDGPAEWLPFTSWAREMMRWLNETCGSEQQT